VAVRAGVDAKSTPVRAPGCCEDVAPHPEPRSRAVSRGERR
jgi:hypothetical protein